jgi:hypothetical protein
MDFRITQYAKMELDLLAAGELLCNGFGTPFLQTISGTSLGQ